MPKEFNETREGVGRRAEDEFHCAAHAATMASIGKHSGQWKLLMYFLLTFTSIVVLFLYNIEQNTRRMELTYTNYIASHTAESRAGFKLIAENKSHIDDHEIRIRTLESH